MLVIVMAIVVSSCSSGAAAPEVMFEARWQCDVQRQTFASLDDLDAELANRLEDTGISVQDYAAFKEKLAASQDLRQDVSDEYDIYCLS